MLSCPTCGHESKIIYTLRDTDRIQRRRECLDTGCKFRWATYEIDADVYRHLMQHSMDTAVNEWAMEQAEEEANRKFIESLRFDD